MRYSTIITIVVIANNPSIILFKSVITKTNATISPNPIHLRYSFNGYTSEKGLSFFHFNIHLACFLCQQKLYFFPLIFQLTLLSFALSILGFVRFFFAVGSGDPTGTEFLWHKFFSGQAGNLYLSITPCRNGQGDKVCYWMVVEIQFHHQQRLSQPVLFIIHENNIDNLIFFCNNRAR